MPDFYREKNLIMVYVVKKVLLIREKYSETRFRNYPLNIQISSMESLVSVPWLRNVLIDVAD